MNNDPGYDALTRIAKAYFVAHINEFLSQPPAEIQRLCTIAGVGEEEFVSACKVLMMAAPARGGAN
jgi:hypothetical protein